MFKASKKNILNQNWCMENGTLAIHVVHCRRKCRDKSCWDKLVCLSKILPKQKKILFSKRLIFLFFTTFKITKSAVVNSGSCVISTWVENLYTASHFFSFATRKNLALANMQQADATRAEPVLVAPAQKRSSFLLISELFRGEQPLRD